LSFQSGDRPVLRVIAVLVAACSVLTGCRGDGGDKGAEGPEESGPITLIVTVEPMEAIPLATVAGKLEARDGCVVVGGVAAVFNKGLFRMEDGDTVVVGEPGDERRYPLGTQVDWVGAKYQRSTMPSQGPPFLDGTSYAALVNCMDVVGESETFALVGGDNR